MRAHTPFVGLVPAVLTPFDAGGALNLSAVGPQAERLARDGVAGVFVGGTTGEFSSLTQGERLALAERWAAVVKGSPTRLVVHVGANCLADAKQLAAQADALGADAISAVAPSYFKPKSVDVLVQWCAELAAAAPNTPFYFYDIPVLTGVALPMVDFLDQAAERVPTLRGVKFTNPDLMTFQRLLRAGGGRFDVLFGMDEQLLTAVVLGAQGAVGSGYNFAAPLYNRLLAAARANDFATARAEQYRGVEVVAVLMRYGYLAAAKELLRLRGLDLGSVRLPHVPLTPDQAASLRRDLESLSAL
ncbi:N-acetylneuraminate lyase [Gemmata obscuriglobus]|uniref:N-acetylneuraminate lyase n=1 Tax=Gemmata obscuriglobus TaxID=114 RepID=A0A2Z3HDI4_9BACT|nr:dihydrodipicolinate synthase family protein [Gemmata obscuriglobus]AWM39744.1 N-acetylneuraminate lyase [Gemmata obscuriglobus]QEG27141.1 N-acetylneuraminate lyase [Gemmata obscuriglobus]VTS03720.1 n-acetylneuraminate lyase : Dihydrodipicolinate synthase/N-acetylneuraminate lyase OS=Singulisphaera acidiphila (strain ATCC BAA-1392 / DSM 18658 / VKM B-2454 / MOB10) GN=Sinac_2107 PE=3 SV=1: DHDPS [Gemmata obscuriglobus UQM 2246]